MISKQHAEWLEDRGISVETATRYGLNSVGSSLAFPYIVNGEIHNTKVRKPGKSFTFSTAGKSLQFWNNDALSEAHPDEPLIITEGEMDTLACLEAGFGCVVSVPNGAAPEPGSGDINPFDDNRCGYLWRDGKLKEEIAARDKIILAVDNDEPGRILQQELVIRIGRKRCFYVQWPDDCKDANEVLIKHGRAELWHAINNARPYVDDVVPFYAAPPEPEAQYYGLSRPALDKHLKFRRPEVCVVTGSPNAGKSQFVRWACLQLAMGHGLRTAILSFEENREQMNRAFRRYCGEVIGESDPTEWINSHMFVMLQSDDEDMTIDWIAERAWIAVRRHGCHVVVIDPWGDIDEDRKHGESYTEWTNRNLRKLVKLSKKLNIILIIVAHPRKVEDDTEITLYDISGSAHFRNKCDTGIVISRPDPEQSIVTVSVQKSRDQERMGKLGEVRMMWNASRATYDQTGVYFSVSDEVVEAGV